MSRAVSVCRLLSVLFVAADDRPVVKETGINNQRSCVNQASLFTGRRRYVYSTHTRRQRTNKNRTSALFRLQCEHSKYISPLIASCSHKIRSWIYKQCNITVRSCEIDTQNANTNTQYNVVIRQSDK